MIGSQSSTSVSTELIGSSQSYVKVFNSLNVFIINVVFPKCAYDISMSLHIKHNFDQYNLAFTNCCYCKIAN